MRKINFVIILAFLASCSNAPKENKPNKDTVQAKPTASSTKLVTVSPAVDTTKSVLAKNLIGVWMSKNTGEATFEIKKSTIHYYRDAVTLPFKIIGDSVSIDYKDGHSNKFSYKFNTSDTLILNGTYGEFFYYRIK